MTQDENLNQTQDIPDLDTSYRPSRSSIIMAAQEFGDVVGEYEERENEDVFEDPASLIEDVADTSVTIETGYVLMDVGLLNEHLSKQICTKCKKKIVRFEQKRTGAMLSYHLFCKKEHKTVFKTQRMVNKQPEGNVAITNAVFCSGMTFASWIRFCLAMNLLSFSSTTYYRVLGKYVKPVIVRLWSTIISTTLETIKIATEKAIWVADGQFDSMGYCAKYLIETVMCAYTGRVVDFVIFQKGLYPGGMEAKGLRFLLNRLKLVVGDKVETICTDRNNSVRKLMREEFSEIIHEYDIWHLAKSIKKRMKKLFKGSKVLLSWIKSIGNHLWWCAQTCGGCADTILYK